MYPFIGKAIWGKFVKFRDTPEFLVKSKKGEENREKNIYNHRLSCGGYDKLEKIMIQEKIKQREQELGNPFRSLEHEPSPPSCHEKWKRIRQRPGSEFSLEATSEFAETIDLLVEKSKDGFFFPRDIMKSW
ncbi:unnamed protein product [Lathyrus oleraceus]